MSEKLLKKKSQLYSYLSEGRLDKADKIRRELLIIECKLKKKSFQFSAPYIVT